MERVDIKTRDGVSPAYVAHPPGAGPWPAVLVFMDGPGIRPAMLAVGERMTSLGYFVLLPDLFYRSGPYEPMNARTVFTDPEQRKVLMEKFFAPATGPNVMSDTRAFLDYLATRRDVIAAAASFHGGRLATDMPDSPHLLAPKMKPVRIYVAGAIEDASFPDDMKERLEEALISAGVDHRVETYPARHGWVLEDTQAHDAPAAERHWQVVAALFGATLQG